MNKKGRIHVILFTCLILGILGSTTLFSSVDAIFIDPIDPPPPSIVTYTIKGWIREEGSGNPIYQARVNIYKDATYIGYRLTDASGYFVMTYRTSYPIVQFKIVVSHTEYYSKTVYQEPAGSYCIFGNVYLTKKPSTTYTVQGNVIDYHKGIDVPGSTVAVYQDTTFLGYASTNAVDGSFTYTYTTTLSISSFRVIVNQEGYQSNEKTAAVSGTVCDMGNVVIQRLPYKSEITTFGFDYDSQMVMEEYWDVASTGFLGTMDLIDGAAAVIGVPNSGSSSTYISGRIDLFGWTGFDDLEIEIRFRFASPGYAPYFPPAILDGANFRLGIIRYQGDPLDEDDWLWKYEDNWEGISDTGWLVRTLTINRVPTADNPGVPTYAVYNLAWGFNDATISNGGLVAYLDYYTISGDGYPSIITSESPDGVLEKNCAGITTTPGDGSFTFGNEYDTDDVGVGYDIILGNSVNTVGMSSSQSPTLEAAISVGMNDDQSESHGITLTEYNIVDSVSISAYVENMQLNERGNVKVTSSKINAYNGGTESNPVYNSAIGLALETIGLIPGVGSYIKYLGHFSLFLYEGTQYYSRNQYTVTDYDSTDNKGYADATFDFGGPLNVPFPNEPPKGITDFKMKVEFQIDGLDWNDVYTVTIEFTVTVKHVIAVEVLDMDDEGNPYVEYIQYSYTDEHTEVYTESLNILYFESGNLDDVHLIESNGVDISEYSSQIGQTTIFNTIYGPTHKVVWLRAGATQIQVSAPYQSDLEIRIFEWNSDVQQRQPIIMYVTDFLYTLELNVAFVRFEGPDASN